MTLGSTPADRIVREVRERKPATYLRAALENAPVREVKPVEESELPFEFNPPRHYIATANVDFVVRARRDPAFRRALQGAHMILCDGTPLLWVSR